MITGVGLNDRSVTPTGGEYEKASATFRQTTSCWCLGGMRAGRFDPLNTNVRREPDPDSITLEAYGSEIPEM
jgi:hypothetical protein